MATQFEIECALMAGRAYQTTRGDINWFSVPQGWTEFSHVPDSTYPTSSGFEAAAFQNGNQIVISYAGTDPKSVSDWLANAGLAVGSGSVQLLQAANYYLKIRQANPNAIITFTGHSLGGGLAALMSVLVDRPAVTFDQAPFESSASAQMRDSIVSKLLALKDAQQQPLYTAEQLIGLAPTLFTADFDPVSRANSNVATIRVEGEFTSSLFPVNAFNPMGPQTMLSHGATKIKGVSIGLFLLIEPSKFNPCWPFTLLLGIFGFKDA